jgi:hypothetical protein
VNNFGVGGVYKDTRILDEETINLIRTLQIPDSYHPPWFGYGSEWRVQDFIESYALWHPGGGSCVATFIDYYILDQVGIILIVNQFPHIFSNNFLPWMNITGLITDKAYSLL